MPVIPATLEAEAGESPEPRRWRLQSAKIALLCSSLGYRARLAQKKEKEIEIFEQNWVELTGDTVATHSGTVVI